MKKVVIYGAASVGKSIANLIKNRYDILFFIDNNKKLQGTLVDNIPVYPPEKLLEYKDVVVIIGSQRQKSIMEIRGELANQGIYNIYTVGVDIQPYLLDEIINQLTCKTIDLGGFLSKEKIFLKELTYISGGSGVMDYAFLYVLANRFKLRNYLEVGTYIGESINIMSSICEKCYSITAPLDAPYSMKNWCKKYHKFDYSNRLAYAKNIVHYYGNSQEFDYSKINDNIDIFFIDGDHSYEGVKRDTELIFDYRSEDSFVVWHDFKTARDYNQTVVKGVYDALGEKFNNVYVTTNNICGIYIPKKWQGYFPLADLTDLDIQPKLYVYNTVLDMEEK